MKINTTVATVAVVAVAVVIGGVLTVVAAFREPCRSAAEPFTCGVGEASGVMGAGVAWLIVAALVVSGVYAAWLVVTTIVNRLRRQPWDAQKRPPPRRRGALSVAARGDDGRVLSGASRRPAPRWRRRRR